jgi:hypothetical protein
MKARIYHEYSELDKRMEYYVESDNVKVWYFLGQITGSLYISIYPYMPTWRESRKFQEVTGKDARSLANKLSKKLITWSKKRFAQVKEIS